MIRRIALLVTAAVMAAMMMLVTAPAFAVSPSQQECEAQGGEFIRGPQGTVTCTIVDEGKPHPNNKFSSIEEESSQGTLQNRPHHQESQECTDTGSGKCPPGQF